MAFVSFPANYVLDIKTVYVLAFFVLLLIFNGLVIAYFYRLIIKTRNTKDLDSSFEEECDAVHYEDIDNGEKGNKLIRWFESHQADCRLKLPLHNKKDSNLYHLKTKDIYHEYYKEHNLLETMCKNSHNVRNYKENILLRQVLLNPISSHLRSPFSHYEHVVFPVHRQEDQQQKRKEKEENESECKDETNTTGPIEINKADDEDQNLNRQACGAKSLERNNKEGKDEGHVTSKNTETNFNNIGNIVEGDKVSGENSDTESNYTGNQVVSNDADSEKERSLTTINFLPERGKYNLNMTDEHKPSHSLEQSCTNNISKQDEANPIARDVDPVAVRVGLRATNGYTSEISAARGQTARQTDRNRKMLQLHRDVLDRKKLLPERQPRLDTPNGKDQPPPLQVIVPVSKCQSQVPHSLVDVHDNNDQPLGPKQEFYGPYRNESGKNIYISSEKQQPLMGNPPKQLSHEPELQSPPQSHVDDLRARNRPPGMQFRKDQPHSPQTNMEVSRPQDKLPKQQSHLDVHGLENQPPGSQPQFGDQVCRGLLYEPQPLIEGPRVGDRAPGMQTQLDGLGHKDQSPVSLSQLGGQCSRNQPYDQYMTFDIRRPQDKPLENHSQVDVVYLKNQPPGSKPQFVDPGHSDLFHEPQPQPQPHDKHPKLDVLKPQEKPPEKRPQIETFDLKNQSPMPKPPFCDPGRSDKPHEPHSQVNGLTPQDKPPEKRSQIEVNDLKNQPPGPKPPFGDPGRSDLPNEPEPKVDELRTRPIGTQIHFGDAVQKDQPQRPQTNRDIPGGKVEPQRQQSQSGGLSHKDQSTVLQPQLGGPGSRDQPRDQQQQVDVMRPQDKPPEQQTKLDIVGLINQPPGPQQQFGCPDRRDNPCGSQPQVGGLRAQDQPSGMQTDFGGQSRQDQPHGLKTKQDVPSYKDKPPEQQPHSSSSGQTPGPRRKSQFPGCKDQLLRQQNISGRRYQSTGSQPHLDVSHRNFDLEAQLQQRRSGSYQIVPNPNTQHLGLMSHHPLSDGQNQPQYPWERLLVPQDQTRASSLQQGVPSNHEERPGLGHLTQRDSSSAEYPYEESIQVNDLLSAQLPDLQNWQSHDDYHEPLNRIPSNGDLLNGLFHNLHEANQQGPINNQNINGIPTGLRSDPSPVIDLNNHERLGLHQIQEILQQDRPSRPRNDEGRQRAANEDLNGNAQRDPMTRLGSLRGCRTVYASRVSRGLRSGTIDENYHLDGHMMCLVCRSRPVSTRLQPCGHLVYCHVCVLSQPSCRQCNELVEDYTDIWE